MTIPQTTYTQVPPLAVNGSLATTGGPSNIKSKSATATIAAGLFVSKGTNTDQCKLPASAGDITTDGFGFALYDANHATNPTSGAGEYVQFDKVPVLTKGEIYVLPQGDVVDDGPVYIVNTGADAGKLRGDNTSATQFARAKVRKGATVASGLFAVVEINDP